VWISPHVNHAIPVENHNFGSSEIRNWLMAAQRGVEIIVGELE
jgi:hypothetical protein